MDRGYIAIWRKIQDHAFYKEKRQYSKFEAWVDMLMEAQHCETEKDVVIKMRVFKSGYGESLKSIRTWGSRWGWGEAKVKRFFDLLVKMNQIRYKNETVTTRITILNYSSYDPKRNSYETRPKRDRNGTETGPKTDKNGKKEKNGKNDILSDSHESDQNVKGDYPESFLKFWEAYPKREGIGAAYKAYQKIKAPRPTLKTILDSIEIHKKTNKWQNKQYIPLASTFLNQRRWEDEFSDDDFSIPRNQETQNKLKFNFKV